MTKNTLRRAIALVLCLAGIVLMVVGGVNMPRKSADAGINLLNDLRAKALMNAAGDGIVESYVAIAKKQAQSDAKAAGGGMAEIRAAVAEAEERVRAEYADAEFTQGVEATPELLAAVSEYNRLLSISGELEEAAKQAYIDAHYEEAKARMEAEREALLAEGKEVPESEEVQVDMSGFEASAEMLEAEAAADAAFTNVGEALKALYPVLDDGAVSSLRGTMEAIIYQPGDTFDVQYDRYAAQSGARTGASGFLIRHADDLIYAGLAVLVAAGLVAVLVLFLLVPSLRAQQGYVMLCLIPCLILLARVFYKKGIVTVRER